MTRAGRAARRNVVVLALVGLMTLAVGTAAAQGPSLSETPAALAADLRRAEALFNSNAMPDARPLLESLRLRFGRLTRAYTADDRRMLGRVLAMQSEFAVGEDKRDAANRLFAHLVALGEARQVTALMSPRVARMLSELEATLTAHIDVPFEAGGMCYIDGLRVDGATPIPVSPGEHSVLLQLEGEAHSVALSLRSGETSAVSWAALTDSRGPDTSSPPDSEEQVTRPPRVPRREPESYTRGVGDSGGAPHVVLRAGLALESSVDVFPLDTPMTLYGKPGSISSSYSFSKPALPTAPELGLTLRFGAFGVGATWQRTRSSFVDSISASVPAAVGANRTLTGDTVPLPRSLDAVHAELSVSVGDGPLTASVFAGPSLLSATQTLVGGVSVRESGAGASLTAIRSDQVQAGRSLGFNLGVGAAWYPTRHLGAGVDARFTRATATVALGSTTIDLPLGGYIVGLGARLRF